MSEIVYDYAVPNLDSDVFAQVFYDGKANTLYLVFKNGTTVSRVLPAYYNQASVESVESWGRAWNAYLKHLTAGDPVENGSTFVPRSQVTVNEPVVEASKVEVDEALLDAFHAAYDDAGWLHEESVEAGLSAVLAELAKNPYAGDVVEGFTGDTDAAYETFIQSLRDKDWLVDDDSEIRESFNEALRSAQPAPQTAESESLADATRNSEGTFVGIGFIDVPADIEARLTSVLGHVSDFVRDELGEVKSLIERYDVPTMRKFMGGIR